MKPYVYESGNGATLRVDPADGPAAMLKATGKNGGESWVPVDALEIPDVTNAMWRAAGQEPPVMLGRPDLASARDPGGWASFRGLQLRESADGGVSFGIGGNLETLTAAQTRQLAAVAVAMADGQPEADDVADFIRAALPAGEDRGADWQELADWLGTELIKRYRFVKREAGDA